MIRWLARAGALLICLMAQCAMAATPVTVAGLKQLPQPAGASVAFQEYEAENAVTNGRVIGPDRRFPSLAAEASGRRAVVIDRPGAFLDVTLARPANALTIRYALPDSADGRGLDATIGAYVGGQRIATLALTSRYTWFYGRYPFTNRPADGAGHHAFDDVRVLLDRVLPAGTTVRLTAAREDRPASWYAVDVVDAEQVAPLQRPAGALALTQFAADPSGRRESSAALRAGIAAARKAGRPLWIPPGRYRTVGHFVVDRVEIAGAGPWYSVLQGPGFGFYGRPAPRASAAVRIRDLAIIGEVTERNDKVPLAGIGGAMGADSRLSNLFIQHQKTGLWFDGPMSGITVSGLRILDTTADGLNFHRGISHALVEDCFIRGTGDDGLAAWSGRIVDHHITFRNNTVIAPVLANGIAIYGGHDIAVDGNVVADTVTEGGALHLGNRFKAVPASGAIRFADNVAVRSGSIDPHWNFGVGALWFYALDAPLAAAVTVRSNALVDSTSDAVLIMGKRVDGIAIDGLSIDGAEHALALRGPGSASLKGLTLRRLRATPLLRCDADFSLTQQGDALAATAQGCGTPSG